MKKTFRFALLAALCLSFGGMMTACGDDDNESNEPEIIVPSEKTVYAGTTVTSPVSDPDDKYESTRGTYAIEYNVDNKTAVLTINGADFNPKMPALVMTFPGINWIRGSENDGTLAFEPVTDNKNVFLLQKDELIPEVMTKPFPQYTISAFVAVEDPGKSLDIKFICAFNGNPMNVTFSGTPEK